MPPDKFAKLAELLRATIPDMERRIDSLQSRPPDPIRQPISHALSKALMSRLELQLASILRGGEGLRAEYRERRDLMKEIEELESWVQRKSTVEHGSELMAERKDEMGDWLCSEMGYSYSRARHLLGQVGRHKRGAPSKRVATLKMMDARVANRWSYKMLAEKMCDCGSSNHNDYCEERIRKRIKGLEKFLNRYKISYVPRL
jgi:hypothetical protein